MSIPDYKTIRPKIRGKSDFFSWRLSERVRKSENNGDGCRIYKSPFNFMGEPSEIGALYIGYRNKTGWFHGQRLKQCCTEGAKNSNWAFPPNDDWMVVEWIDITDEFYKKYLEIGVCAIHGNFAHNYKEINKAKKICEYCKKTIIRKSRRVTEHIWVVEQ